MKPSNGLRVCGVRPGDLFDHDLPIKVGIGKLVGVEIAYATLQFVAINPQDIRQRTHRRIRR